VLAKVTNDRRPAKALMMENYVRIVEVVTRPGPDCTRMLGPQSANLKPYKRRTPNASLSKPVVTCYLSAPGVQTSPWKSGNMYKRISNPIKPNSVCPGYHWEST